MAAFKSFHRTVDLGCSMDTFLNIELQTSAVLWTHFNTTKTAGLRQLYGHFSNRVDQNHKNCRPYQFFPQFLDTKYEDELGQLKSIHKTATIRSFCGFGLSRWKRSCFSILTLTGYGKKALMRSPP